MRVSVFKITKIRRSVKSIYPVNFLNMSAINKHNEINVYIIFQVR